MGDEVHLWEVGEGDQLAPIQRGRLDLESRLEEWLKRDISVLDPALLVIGSQVESDGGPIDILCIDSAGDLVIVELKRDKTPRLITAQVLDYASHVASFSHDDVTETASAYLRANLEDAFRTRFGIDLPEALNADHRMLVVGSEIDASSERIIRYLSDEHGVNINAATFQYFRQPDGRELLARVFLIEPSDVERSVRAKGTSKRRANLSYEELETQADEAGVRELYDYVVASLEGPLRKSTTRSSIRFEAVSDGRRKVITSLLPGESNAGDGLRFQLYKNRYAELVGVSLGELEGLMPARRENWVYYGSTDGDPDWDGYEGFIANREEVDRLAEPLRRSGQMG
jgi:hypothetical protein